MANLDTKKLLVGMILLGVLIVGGSYMLALLSGKKSNAPGTTSTPSSDSSQTSQNQPTKEIVIPKAPVFSGKEVINLTANGFDPATITITKSTLIQWINKSGADATVSSNEHPTHQLYSPLNLGLFANESGVSLIFNTPGTYKYHDHLHPQRTGTVIVE